MFRRNAPIQKGVSKTSPYSINSWGNIAAVAYKTSAKPAAFGDKKVHHNIACWFNTFNKSMLSGNKSFPLPVPGGVYGTTEEEKRLRQVAIDFWDTPAEHRTLSANFGKAKVSNKEGDNCVTCHGNGPVLGARWVWENAGDASDGDLPYVSAASLHDNCKFFKLDDDGCGECHTYWSANSDSCDTMIDDYAGHKMNRYFSSQRTKLDSDNVDYTHLMPPEYGLDLEEWKDTYADSIEAIKSCCDGNTADCMYPIIEAKTPMYYGAHQPQPSVTYSQQVTAPASGEQLSAQASNCAEGACEVSVSWQDPNAMRFGAPVNYQISIGDQKSIGCASGRSEDLEASIKSTVLDGWRNQYKTKTKVTCQGAKTITICGVHNSHRVESKSAGTTVNLDCN